jgi:hypothetical protein
MQDPIRKIIKAKRTGGMAQMVVCLLSEWEALSSNSSTSKSPNKIGRAQRVPVTKGAFWVAWRASWRMDIRAETSMARRSQPFECKGM